MNLQNQMNKTAQKIDALSKKMKEMENAKVPTDEYKAVQAQIEAATTKLSALNERMMKWQELGKSTKSTAFKAMQYDAAELENTIEYAKGELLDLEQTGSAFKNQTGTDAYRKTASDLASANVEMSMLKAKATSVIASQKGMTNEAGKLTTRLKQTGKQASKIVTALKGALAKMKSLHSSTGKTNKGFSNMARTMKQMMLSMAVFQIMSKGLEFVSSGLQNLAVYSKEYNKTMSEFVSSTSQLKDALAVAFQPILNVVIPILTKFINYISTACNAMSRFFAILSGKSTYTKAIKQNKDYAASLDQVGDSADSANSSLAGFDDLDVLSQQTSSSSSSSDGADGSGFAEEAVGAVSDWAQEFKDAIDSGDWYGVGSLLAEKLNGIMDAIDWKSIQKKARKFGTNVALGINGFINTFDWYGLGTTLGSAIQTVIETAFGFVTTFDWVGAGEGFGESVNGFFNSIDWGMLAITLSKSVEGLLDTVIGFLDTVNWDQIGEDVATFLKNVDWVGVLTKVATTIWKAVCAVWDFLCGLISGLFGDFLPIDEIRENVEDAYNQLLSFINNIFSGDWKSALENLGKIYTDIWNNIKIYAGVVWEAIKKVISSALAVIKQKMTEILGAISEKWISVWESIKTKVSSIWESIKSIVSTAIGLVKSGIATTMSVINSIWSGDWEGAKNTISNVWSGIQLIVSGAIDAIKTNLSNVLNTISGVWSHIWGSMKDTVTDIFNGIWSAIKGVINSILGGIESMVNGVVKGLNGMINAVNKIKIDVPGVGSFGVDIPNVSTVSIPRLANGGITTGSTLANIGEAGREAVLPLENNTDWMNDLADKINGNRTVNIRFTGTLASLGQVLKPVIDTENTRIGTSLILD